MTDTGKNIGESISELADDVCNIILSDKDDKNGSDILQYEVDNKDIEVDNKSDIVKDTSDTNSNTNSNPTITTLYLELVPNNADVVNDSRLIDINNIRS
jgi:hypothetical protein